MDELWVEEYYNALDFYFWEPQHLGRQKRPALKQKTADEVRSGVRRLEVSLNHLLKFFFVLTPLEFRNLLFALGFEKEISGSFALEVLSTNAFDAKYDLQNVTQPDFLFIAPDTTVALEMKITAKCSIRQIFKYVLLALAVEEKVEKPLDHYLLLLAQGDFAGLWKDRYKHQDALRVALHDEAASFMDGHPFFAQVEGTSARFSKRRFEEVISNIVIGFVNYQSFAQLLTYKASILEDIGGDQVYRNLIKGLLFELEERKLSHPVAESSLCERMADQAQYGSGA